MGSMETTETLDRSGEAAPFSPDDSWLDAFDDQATAELISRARRYAERQARWIERAGGRVDPMDLVLGVFDDTRAGVVRWDPGRCPLVAHVLLAIRSRARHHRQRALRFRHQSIDPDRSSDPVVEDALAAQRRDAELERDAADGALVQLRTLAGDDPDVNVLLDAYSVGAYERRDVVRLTGWNKGRYRNTRIRLDRIIQRFEHDAGAVCDQA